MARPAFREPLVQRTRGGSEASDRSKFRKRKEKGVTLAIFKMSFSSVLTFQRAVSYVL